MPKDLSLIIPTYNEVDNIEEIENRIAASLKDLDYEVIFVDDGSPDGTADAIEWFGKIHGDFRLIRRNSRKGLSSAIISGVGMAASDVVAVIDGDLQHPPELLPLMLAKIKLGFDVVVASRYIDGGSGNFSNLGRKLLSNAAVLFAHQILPRTKTVEDVVSGFFMFRKRVLKGAKLSLIGTKLLLEIVSQNNVNSLTELPYTFAVRGKGRSKMVFGDLVKFLCLIIMLRLNSKGSSA